MAITNPPRDQDPMWESVDERSSLLPNNASPEDPRQILDKESKIPALTRRSCLLCAAIILLLGLLSVGGLLQALPLNQVLESILCAQLQLDGYADIQCGENSVVQAELAALRGWQTVFGLVPGKSMNLGKDRCQLNKRAILTGEIVRWNRPCLGCPIWPHG